VVAIYFVAAAAAAQCSTIYSSALELTDCIYGRSVFGQHTVIAVNIILSKSGCTIFITCPSNISTRYKNVCTSVITRNTNIWLLEQNMTANIGLATSLSNA